MPCLSVLPLLIAQKMRRRPFLLAVSPIIRSTITTLALSAVQQDQQWKAYVGNVTGILTLRDSTNYAIYEWPLTGATIAGEVFASRSNSVVWSNITCANSTLIAAEEVFHNMTPGSVDSINLTFNYTLHAAMQIGPKIIPESNCSVTATYVNNTASDCQPICTISGDSSYKMELTWSSPPSLRITLMALTMMGLDPTAPMTSRCLFLKVMSRRRRQPITFTQKSAHKGKRR
jgi:hypothetical protein